MRKDKDMDIIKILELLKLSGLFSEEEMSGISGYLYGDTDEGVLAQFMYRNLSDMLGTSDLCAQYQEFLDRKEYGMAGKLGKLFFALGQASAYELYPMAFFYCQGAELWAEPSSKAAIFAMKMAVNQCQANRETFLELFRIAEQKPENLLKAMEYEAGGLYSGKLVLQAAYFAMRYPRGQQPERQGGSSRSANKQPEPDMQSSTSKQPEPDAQSSTRKQLELNVQSSTSKQLELDGRSSMGKPSGAGSRGVMGKLFVSGSCCGIQMGGQDKQILETYERSLLCLIPVMCEKVYEEADIQRIVEAVESDQMDRSILKLAGTSQEGINTYPLFLLAKCAYLNYTLSVRIKNVVSVCLAWNMDLVLECIEQVDLYDELEKKGGNFDVVFGIDSQNLIKWAVRKNRDEILRVQFGRNPESYMAYMDGSDYNTCNTMGRIVEEMDMGRYEKWLGKEAVRRRLKLVEAFVEVIESLPKAAGTGLAEDVRGYLRREKGVEVAYDCKGILGDIWYWAYKVRTELMRYQRNYGYDSLSDRCETLLVVGHGLQVYQCLGNDGYQQGGAEKKPAEVLERLFAVMESQGVDMFHQLEVYVFWYENDGQGRWEEEFWTVGKERFGNYLRKRREEMLAAFRKVGSSGRILGLEVMAEEAQENQQEILYFAQDTSKRVRETLLRILYGRKDWEEEVAGLLQANKASVREIGVQVLARWLEEATVGLREKYIRILTQALEKEKNTKVRDLLGKVLQVSGEESGESISEEELVKEIHKGNKKRVLAWAYETPFSKVHRKDGKEADEVYLQAILLCYYVMSPCGESPSASFLAASVDEGEFAVYVGELLDKWVEAGADAKKRWVLYAAAIHGGAGMVSKLYHQIQEWPKEARGAIAVEAVRALALSPEKQALVIVDQMSRKFKFNKVKAAAGEAMDFAAAQLGISREELEDRIVPDLGFDEKMQRIFDYGSRRFTAALTTSLEIEVFDENHKKLKALPAPGKRDDGLKAAAAYEEFKQLKKQLKTIISSQEIRLELAFSTGRQWSISAWKKLFVENPLMHQFATGLVWGIYENGRLQSSFRYMEDGSYNTEEEEEFALPDDKTDTAQLAECGQYIGRDHYIGLVHPIELSEASLKVWKEQFSDYEMIQPIAQLSRPVYYKTEEEAKQKNLERFGGIIVNELVLRGKLTTFGWKRGLVDDAGRFYTYYREEKGLSLGAELHFSGSYVGGESGDVTVYEVSFYKTGDAAGENADQPVKEKSQMKEKIQTKEIAETKEKTYALKDLPDRYFSEIVLQIFQATVSGTERNENWRKDRI